MNGKLPDKVVFDTNALLGFLKKYGGFFDVSALFPETDLFISEITESVIYPGFTTYKAVV